MGEDQFSLNSQQVKVIVSRFEEMMRNEDYGYFDVIEMEHLIDYYFDDQNFDNSWKVIEMAVIQHPTSIVFKLKKARHLSTMGETDEALTLAEEISKIEPNNSEVYLIKADVYSQEDNHKLAIENYKISLSILEDQEDVLDCIASEYILLSDYANALHYLKESLKVNTENDTALNEVGMCFNMLKKHSEGIDYIKEYIDINPYSQIAWFNLGYLYSNISEIDKAIEAFDFAIVIEPKFLYAYHQKGYFLSLQEKFDQALEAYKEASENCSEDPAIYCCIGECYENKKDFESGLEYYQKAHDLDPGLSETWVGIGQCYFEIKEYKKSLKTLTEATKLFQDNANIWCCLAEIQYKLLHLEDSRKSYLKSISLDPDIVETWLDLSDTFAYEENFTSALFVINDAINHDNDIADYHFRKAIYEYCLEKKEDAFNTFEEGLKINPDIFENSRDYCPEFFNEKKSISLIQKYTKENN
ncbi:MAG: tetratricopeptide repeat protein [Bacteroidales bacterium]